MAVVTSALLLVEDWVKRAEGTEESRTVIAAAASSVPSAQTPNMFAVTCQTWQIFHLFLKNSIINFASWHDFLHITKHFITLISLLLWIDLLLQTWLDMKWCIPLYNITMVMSSWSIILSWSVKCEIQPSSYVTIPSVLHIGIIPGEMARNVFI